MQAFKTKFKFHLQRPFSYMKLKTKSTLSLLLRNKIKISFGLILFFMNYENIMIKFSSEYRINNCTKAIIDRFSEKQKYHHSERKQIDDNLNTIGTIFPTTYYDIQALLVLANKYCIPAILDINDNQLFVPHFKIDMSNFNSIHKIDYENDLIKVEIGAKIKDILEYLHKDGKSIEILEKYKDTNLRLIDILFNSFNGYSDGKYIDYFIDNYNVVIPNNGRVLNVKQTDNITLSGYNLKNLFLRNSFTLGIILDVSLKIKKLKNYKYIPVLIEKNIEECLEYQKNLRNQDIEGLKDIIITTQDNQQKFNLYIKIKEDKLNKHENQVWLNRLESIHHFSGDETLIRKIKITIPKSLFSRMINNIFKFSKYYNVPVSGKFSVLTNEIELDIFKPNSDDAMNVYLFIDRLNSKVLKLRGNIFINNHVKVNSKYYIMRDFGVENYKINEEIKAILDPNYVLNPHLSIIKPDILKSLKRENKLLNYLFSKIEL